MKTNIYLFPARLAYLLLYLNLKKSVGIFDNLAMQYL